MAHSLAFDRDFRLTDDYEAVARGATAAGRTAAGKNLDRHVRSIDGRDVFSHPVGLPLLAVPVLLVNDLIGWRAAPDIALALFTLSVTFVGLVVMWRLMSQLVRSTRHGALLVATVYFGSPLWYYSRTFFTEPFTWSFASFAVASVASNRFLLASLYLGVVLALKETAAILVIAIVFGSVCYFGLRRCRGLFVGPALYVLFFLWKNYQLTGTKFSTFQPYQIGDPFDDAMGLLVDPIRGLLWYSPLLLAVSLAGWLRHHNVPRCLLWASAAAIVGYFLITAAWVDWRGGSSFSTRLLVPALPALLVPCASLFQRSARFRRWLLPLFVLSFIPNWVAANRPFVAFWGEIPVISLLTNNLWIALAGMPLAGGLYALISSRFPDEDAPRSQAAC